MHGATRHDVHIAVSKGFTDRSPGHDGPFDRDDDDRVPEGGEASTSS
jgi:hypothetical protein